MSASNNNLTFRLIIFLFILPGLLVAIWRCSLRIIGENKHKYVDIAVDLAEFSKLAREEGIKTSKLLKSLKENGASSVVISEDTLEKLSDAGLITLMTDSEVRKLSLNNQNFLQYSQENNTVGSLWVYSEHPQIIDRISYTLGLKIGEKKIIRPNKNLVIINKSTEGITNKVGVGYSDEIAQLASEYKLGLIYRIGNYPNLSTNSIKKLLNMIPSPASVTTIIFEGDEVLGFNGELNSTIELFKNEAYRLGDIEFAGQKGMEHYIKVLKTKKLITKVHSITRKEMDLKYNINTAVSRWVRAAVERSIRILYFRCFNQNEKHFIDNLFKYNIEYLNKTSKALKKSGLNIAENNNERISESRLIIGKPKKTELLAIGIALLISCLLLLKHTICPNLTNNTAIISLFVLIFIFFILNNNKWISISGAIGAVSFSSLGVISALNSLEKKSQDTFIGKLLFCFISRILFYSVLGGILIAGLHTDIIYLLKYEQFRGVKVAFILPVIFSVLWSIKLYGGKIVKLLYKPMNIISFSLLCIVAGACFIYILRSGNVTFLKPSESEESFRNMLEEIFIARPRNKEFLIGYPAIFMLIFFWIRKSFAILPLLTLFVQMGQVSVVNSMCHFHTPLKLTALRIFNGLWLGVLIGIIALIFVFFFRLLYLAADEKKNKAFLIGYFGFGNLGDELLWNTFASKFKNDFPNYEIAILYSSKLPKDESQIYKFINRKNLIDLFEELLTCKLTIIPGGGVFQSSTSIRSLIYYLTLITIAKICGAKIILLSQGLGPWNESSKFGKFAVKWLKYILSNADYISLRDKASGDEFASLTGKDKYSIATDLVFLDKRINKASLRTIHKKIKIYAILRSSIPEAYNIAESLINLTSMDSNLELFPVSMQPKEDEKVWREKGWQGNINKVLENGSIFNGADIVISMRLHGCILSTIACIPWLGLSYDPKVFAYSEYNSWELCIDPTDANEECLKMIIDQMKKSRVNLSMNLHKIAMYNVEIAENDYNTFKSAINI